MESKYNYEIIRDYLHGVVDQETARNIRDLIRTDEVTRNIAAGILQLEHEFDGDDTRIEEYIEVVRQKQLALIAEPGKTVKMSSGWNWIRMAAAILVIGLVGSALWLTLRSDDLLERELREPYPLAILDRGSQTDKAFEHYINEEYAKAIDAFGNTSDDVSNLFYKGLSYLYSGQYDDAVTTLGLVQSSRYNEQAFWFQTLALIKAGKLDDARRNLEQIGSNRSHYKSSEARQLLSSLGK